MAPRPFRSTIFCPSIILGDQKSVYHSIMGNFAPFVFKPVLRRLKLLGRCQGNLFCHSLGDMAKHYFLPLVDTYSSNLIPFAFGHPQKFTERDSHRPHCLGTLCMSQRLFDSQDKRRIQIQDPFIDLADIYLPLFTSLLTRHRGLCDDAPVMLGNSTKPPV